jgi:hypothetical protein
VRIFFALLLIVSSFKSGWSQSVNYRDVFGEDWQKARTYVNENRIWIEPILKKNDIPYPLAVAVIFPELVRYSALRDKMEITLLKALYINLGEDYANFSIGRFQMKPSFAEMIREQSTIGMRRKSGIVFKKRSEFDNIQSYRKSIVKDLEDPETEFNYLIAFFSICEKRFNTQSKNEADRLKFLATAYNFGFDKSSGQIENMIDKKFFNTKLFKTENYSYADVSLCWYRQYNLDK